MNRRNREQDRVDAFSDTGYRKNAEGDSERSVSWHDGRGSHTETTVIHKNVPAVGTILLTAFVFTIIGALIAGMIFVARFTDIKTIASALLPKNDSEVQNTPPPVPGVNSPDPGRANDVDPTGDPHQGGFNIDSGIPELYDQNVGGVVIVQSYDGNSFSMSNLVGTGTGFCISDNGYIMTNAHVVSDADRYKVKTYDGHSVQATLIGSDVRTDIAVLKIDDASLLKPLRIGDSSKVRTGDFVFAIGHPTGDELSFTATFGMVGAVERSVVVEGVRNDYIQIDAAINPGNSGGPLFDMNGNVIGVNSAKTVIASYDENGDPINAEGLGFALPINMAMDTAAVIINEGGIKRPGIGISTFFVDDERAEYYSIPTGCLVYTITEDGPGHLAGLNVDDIITHIDGRPVESNEMLGEYVRTKSIGDSVELSVWRDGEELTLTLVIGDLNALSGTVLNDEYGGHKYGFR